jgi:hypothetical protein
MQLRKSTPRGLGPLRAEPNVFRVHVLSRSDTMSCNTQGQIRYVLCAARRGRNIAFGKACLRHDRNIVRRNARRVGCTPPSFRCANETYIAIMQKQQEILTPVEFELTQLAPGELESAPLDNSGKVSLTQLLTLRRWHRMCVAMVS